jgi:hypothetical protein
MISMHGQLGATHAWLGAHSAGAADGAQCHSALAGAQGLQRCLIQRGYYVAPLYAPLYDSTSVRSDTAHPGWPSAWADTVGWVIVPVCIFGVVHHVRGQCPVLRCAGVQVALVG